MKFSLRLLISFGGALMVFAIGAWPPMANGAATLWPPDQTNIAAPLNSGPNTQQKRGSLVIGSSSDDCLEAGTAYAVAVSGGMLYAGGRCHENGQYFWRLERRVISSGRLDATFGANGVIKHAANQVNPSRNFYPFKIVVDAPAGAFYVLGYGQYYGDTSGWLLEKRSMENGALVDAFDFDGVESGPDGTIMRDLAVDDQSLYLVGDAWNAVDGYFGVIEKQDKTNGVPAPTFGANGRVEFIRDGVDVRGYDLYAVEQDSANLYIAGTWSDNHPTDYLDVRKVAKTSGGMVSGFGVNGEVRTDYVVQSSGVVAAFDSTGLYVSLSSDNGPVGDCAYHTELYRFSGLNGNLLYRQGCSLVTEVKDMELDATSVYLFGTEDVFTPSTDTMIDKRSKSTGNLDPSFDGDGQAPGGSISKYFRDATLDQGSLFIGGDSDKMSAAYNVWYIEKRSASTGGLDATFNLLAAAGSKLLCLNPQAPDVLNDPMNCISSWGGFASAVGSFLALSTDDIRLPANNPESYTRQSGYLNLANPSDAQAYTVITQPPDVTVCGAVSHQCAGTGRACYVNSDCQGAATSVYAAGNSVSTAALFKGTVLNSAGRFCLGGVERSRSAPDPGLPQYDAPGGFCITTWSELRDNVAYVQRQSSTTTAQTGGAALARSAIFQAGAFGDPAGLALSFTCGDGICSPPNETEGTCAQDCSFPIAPQSFAAQFPDDSSGLPVTVNLPITAGVQQPPGSTVRILVVRSTSSTPSFTPANGVPYLVGQPDIGNDKIIAAQNATSGAPVSPMITDSVNLSTHYYYRVYQGTTYPSWNPIYLSDDIEYVKLTVSVPLLASSATFVGKIQGSPGYDTQLDCGADCIASLNRNDAYQVTFSRLDAGCTVVYGSCTSVNGAICSITMSGDKTITAQITCDSGGGGGGGGKKPPPQQCFAPGTMVKTPTGDRPIESLKIGDAILAFDDLTGRTVVSHVLQTFVHEDSTFGTVRFSDGTTVEVTAAHRFYQPRLRTWRPIGEMHLGDLVQQGTALDARLLRITAMEFTSRQGTVYNLSVDRYHTYYANGLVVHNVKI